MRARQALPAAETLRKSQHKTGHVHDNRNRGHAAHSQRDHVDQLYGTLDAIKGKPGLGKFQFRAKNRWVGGAHNQSTIRDFYGAGHEVRSRAEAFIAEAGEPAVLLGTDTGPNPAEFLLHALAACLTTSIVYVAAARGVELVSVESTLEGDPDVRVGLGIDESVRNGFADTRELRREGERS